MENALAMAPAGIIPAAHREAIHLGADCLPFVEVGEGVMFQLLHADLMQGLWVVRTKFAPGIEIPRHYHTGPVLAVTHSGRWHYKEYPAQMNSAGSYLFEPAGSVHTLVVPADQADDVLVWFAVFGANVNMAEDGSVIGIDDAQTMLNTYRALTAQQGLSSEAVLVVGG